LPLYLKYNDDEIPVKIIGINGKPGTGIKKAMITCFYLVHVKLIINKVYHMPIFKIHDKLENIDLMELSNIVKETRNFEGQYIFLILNDGIEKLGIERGRSCIKAFDRRKIFWSVS